MILLRHGQSEFNVRISATRRDPGLIDPCLTEFGHRQAERAAASLRHERIGRIVVSPYSRTLQTAEPIARALGVPMVVHSGIREKYGYACDIGTTRDKLRRRWPDLHFDHLPDTWWPDVDETGEDVVARAAAFRTEMVARPDWQETLVVSHWGFIVGLTGQHLQNGEWMRYDPSAPPPSDIVWRH